MGFYAKWWIYGTLVGLLLLSCERDHLFKYNLHDTYADGEYPAGPACTGTALTARTIDGSCNDLDHPAMGSAGMRFGRNVPIENTYPDMDNLMNPNPRDISRELIQRDEIKEVTQINYLATAWIQFMIHDWFDHGDNESDNPYIVYLQPDDPLAVPIMEVERTRVDPSKDPSNGRPPTYQNTVTAWWDGSQVYGSDTQTNQAIRSFVDGKLLMDNNRLPLDASNGADLTGFNKNWWIGLSMLHHLFVQEHNAIADMLKTNNPGWDDERLYNTARLINAALMAKIHTVEWTPAILKNKILARAMNANWEGLFPTDGAHSGNVILHGIMGSSQDHHSAPYSLTEEFATVYRMHPLLRDDVEVRNYQNHQLMGVTTLEGSAFEHARGVMDQYGMTNLFYSFGHTHPGALELNNYPKFLSAMPMPDGSRLDLGAVDLIRDRERGVPRYNEFRRLINLKPVDDFTDITPDTALAERMRTLYNDDIETLDVFVGMMAEGYRPPGYGFGETAFQIFIAMASRRLQSDRFFTDDYRPEIYTQEGLDWIDNSGINAVLLRHMPELATALDGNINAFFPWDE